MKKKITKNIFLLKKIFTKLQKKLLQNLFFIKKNYLQKTITKFNFLQKVLLVDLLFYLKVDFGVFDTKKWLYF